LHAVVEGREAIRVRDGLLVVIETEIGEFVGSGGSEGHGRRDGR
jgi:hypothetical protein